MIPIIESDRGSELRRDIAAVRARYDALDRGRSAAIRRIRTARELELEPVYWRIAEALGREKRQLTHVVLGFPLAPHRSSAHFSFGQFLRARLGDSDGSKLRFRRLVAARDRDEFDHRLRGLLRLAASEGGAVDWGALGLDILWFFGETGSVRRRWAQDFYAPLPTDSSALPEPESNPSL